MGGSYIISFTLWNQHFSRKLRIVVHQSRRLQLMNTSSGTDRSTVVSLVLHTRRPHLFDHMHCSPSRSFVRESLILIYCDK